MLGVPAPIFFALTVLFFGALICLLLEVAGVKEGFRKSGKRPHIALVAFLCPTLVGIYFLAMDLHAKSSASFIFDDMAKVAIFFSCLIALFCVALAVPQMRHINSESGEGYALLLITLALVILLCITQDVFYFALCGILWLMTITGLSIFRGTRRITSEIAAKLMVSGAFWFVIMALASSLAILCSYATQFDTIVSATLVSSTSALAKMTWAFVFVGALSFVGLAPFFWFHIDYIDGAPSFASVAFAFGSFIGGGVILLRMIAISEQMGALNEELITLLWFFAAISILTPGFLAADQQRVGRMCDYLFVIQPGILLVAALSAPNLILSDPSIFFLQIANVALSLPGMIAGLSFWKATAHSEKTWEDYAGAGRKHPIIAVAWLIVIASLVGLPGTLGFSIRILVIQNAFSAEQIWVGIVVVIAMIIGAVPVLRLFIFLFAKPTHHELIRHHQPKQTFLVFACGILVLVGGIFPRFFAGWLTF